MNALFILKLQSIILDKQYINEIIIFCQNLSIDNISIHIVDDPSLNRYSHKMIPKNCIQLTQCIKLFVNEIYLATMFHKHQLNVDFIFSNLFRDQYKAVSNSQNFNNVITNFEEGSHLLIKRYIEKIFPNSSHYKLHQINLFNSNSISPTNEYPQLNDIVQTYKSVCVGGTFDRLHIGHKILLTNAAFLAEQCITIGVTDENMNRKKELKELIEPLKDRINAVNTFILKVKPHLKLSVVPISDMFGPTIVDTQMDCLVVSEETFKGAEIINSKRNELGLKELAIEVVKLVKESTEDSLSLKVSSSTDRKKMLGTLLRPLIPKENLPTDMYIIGLTGGIASGKSSICRRLEKLGAAIIDCDKLGHRSYETGSETFNEIVHHFGHEIINEDGSIDRNKLGPIVFKDKAKLTKLNEIVWPAIAKLAQHEIDIYRKKGKKIIILDAAVLLEAKWDLFVHEVWTSIVPESEAIKRIVNRNKLSESAALERIQSQLSNQQRVDQSNVVFSTLWEEEFTQKQVEKAWQLLSERIAHNIV